MKKLFCAIFAILLAIPTAASPSVSARSALLMTLDGDVLFEKNADERLPMASTTKIMTCLVAIENCSLADIVEVTEESAGVEGSSLYLRRGDRVSVKDLLYAAMLRSANDAASALAVHTAGSVEAFAELMNEKARELGMENTHFANPHGLPDEEHYTTARDFARLASRAMQNKTFAAVAGTKEYVVTVNGNEKRPVKNHNRLLFSYDGACGVKTGFTKASGRCLVSAAERDGVTLVCVTLDAPDDWEDHRRLLNYGFSITERRLIAHEGEIEKVLHTFGEGYVTVTNAEALEATVRVGSDVTFVFCADRYPALPIAAGDPLGSLTVVSDGRTVAECELAASEDVPLPEEKGLFQKIKDFFG